MEHLRAGAALFNAGHYLAAHEPWEKRWLQDARGERDSCIQGLVQATAATYKARTGNWTGAVGLAESGAVYLEDCGYDELQAWVQQLAADPELAERERPPALAVAGEVRTVDDVQFPAAGIAAEALAETRGDEVVECAVEYAEDALAAGNETSPFVSLTLSYLREDAPVVRERIADHVRRRASRDGDVEGLFEME